MLDNRHMGTVRLALCQLNPTVGDIAANESAIAASLADAREHGAQLVIFGELAVTGYPPEDLVYKSQFLRDRRLSRARRRRPQLRRGARRR
jgi:NAD+ synthase (glutamine-hydrolysing)